MGYFFEKDVLRAKKVELFYTDIMAKCSRDKVK